MREKILRGVRDQKIRQNISNSSQNLYNSSKNLSLSSKKLFKFSQNLSNTPQKNFLVPESARDQTSGLKYGSRVAQRCVCEIRPTQARGDARGIPHGYPSGAAAAVPQFHWSYRAGLPAGALARAGGGAAGWHLRDEITNTSFSTLESF